MSIENSQRVLTKLTLTPLKARGSADHGGNLLARLSLFTNVAIDWSADSVVAATTAAGDEARAFLSAYAELSAGTGADKLRPLRGLMVQTSNAAIIGAITSVNGVLRSQADAKKQERDALPAPPPADRNPTTPIWIRFRQGQQTGFGKFGRGQMIGEEENVVWVGGGGAAAADPNAAKRLELTTAIGNLESQISKGNQAIRQLTESKPTEPLGLIFLEQLTLTPDEVQNGELVYSLPLAPKEKVTLSHKEWRIQQEDFTQSVQDYLERYSEKGVTTATELSVSTNDVTSRTDAIRASNTRRTGNTTHDGAANVTTTESVDATNNEHITQNQNSRSTTATESRTATELASARSVQDHKISFTVSTVAGAEDFTSRILENSAADQTMRVDYFRRMLRWKVRLDRVGVRLSYSVTLPDPGYDLRQPYLELQTLQAALSEGFAFDLNPASIDQNSVASLSSTYGIALPPYNPNAVPAWQSQVWETCRAAAWSRFTAAQSQMRARRDELEKSLSGTNPVRLRRLEQEQLMYQVMKWLFPRLNDSFKHWEDPGQFSVDWEDALEYGEYISMVHEAIDWDNMLVSFYPYFWDANAAGEQKPLLQHPDPEHREFLRAGAAKIILAIKPSYEEAVLSLLEQGEIGTLVEGHSFKAVIAQVSAEAEARRQSPDTIGEWETWTPTGALDIAVLLRKVQAE